MRTAHLLTVTRSAGGGLPGGVCQKECWDRTLWTEFLTNTCENITFPQLLLWAVIKFWHLIFTI